MATSSLGVLTVDVLARVGGFVRGMDQAERRTRRMDRNMRRFQRNMKRHFGKVARSARHLALSFAGIGTALGATIAKFSGMVESLGDVSDQIGATAGEVQILRRAAKVAGTDITSLDKSLSRYVKRIGNARAGTGAAVTTLERLGVSADKLAQMPLTDQLKYLIQRLNGIEDAATRASIADGLFGDGWRDMLPLINAGADGIEAAKQRIEDLGIAIDDDGVRKTVQMRTQFRKLASDISSVLMRAVVDLSPQIKELADHFSDIITHAAKTGQIEAFFDTIGRKIQELKEGLNDLAKFGSNALIARLFGLPAAGLAMIAQTGGSTSGWQRRLNTGRPQDGDLQRLPDKQLHTLLQTYNQRAKELLKYADTLAIGSKQWEAAMADAQRYAEAGAKVRKFIDGGPMHLKIQGEAPDPTKPPKPLAPAVSGGGGNPVMDSEQFLDRMYRKWEEADQRYEERRTLVQQLTQDLETQHERAARIFEERKQLIAENVHDVQLAAQLKERAEQAYIDATEDGYSSMSQFAIQAAREIQDAFADYLFNPLRDGFLGMVKGFTDALRRMAANLISSNLLDAVQQLATAFGKNHDGLLGWLATSLGKGLSGKRAAGGPVLGGHTYLVGERGPELFTPAQRGHITPNNALGGDVVVQNKVEIINNTGADVRRETVTDPAGQQVERIIIGAMRRDLESGGPYSRGLQAAFGLNRNTVVG